MMLGLDGGLMERLSLCRHSQCRVYNAMQCLPCLLWTAVKSTITGRPWDERLGAPDRSTSSRLLRAGAGPHYTTLDAVQEQLQAHSSLHLCISAPLHSSRA